jgi:hypothetical protein
MTQWKPGQSGNLNGRPVGTRQAFSAGFLRDLAEVWSEEGRETMVKTARTNPAVFFATCARLIPNDVRVTVQQQLPGNLSAEDWAMIREIVEAVKQAIPDAAHPKPGEVFQHVLSTLRQAEGKTIDKYGMTQLYGPAVCCKPKVTDGDDWSCASVSGP